MQLFHTNSLKLWKFSIWKFEEFGSAKECHRSSPHLINVNDCDVFFYICFLYFILEFLGTEFLPFIVFFTDFFLFAYFIPFIVDAKKGTQYLIFIVCKICDKKIWILYGKCS